MMRRRSDDDDDSKLQLKNNTVEHNQQEREAVAWRQEQLRIIQEKLDELHRSEEQANQLISMENAWMNCLDKLNTLDIQMGVMKEKFSRTRNDRMVLHHHQAAMRKRLGEIRKELSEELEWLSCLKKLVSEKELKLSSKDKITKHSVEAMMKTIRDELEMNYKLETELERLHPHEVARLWAQKVPEWENESQIRVDLLKDQLNMYRSFVEAQLKSIRKEQRNELEAREMLLNSLEQMRDVTSSTERDGSHAAHSSHTPESRPQELVGSVEAAYEKAIRESAENLHLEDNKSISGDEHALKNFRRPGGNIW